MEPLNTLQRLDKPHTETNKLIVLQQNIIVN